MNNMNNQTTTNEFMNMIDEAKGRQAYGDLSAIAYQLVNKCIALEKGNKRTEEVPNANDYKTAMDVQSASNLSGVVHSFARVIPKIMNKAKELKEGTDWANEHPICRLYVEQLRHLTIKTSYEYAHDYAEKEIEKLS